MSAADFQWYLEEPLGVNDQGEIIAPTAPGLGVQPDADKLEHYAARAT
jgi:L-alanine-DL-glutamate epimerase-like enolase superfamily enzyme